MVACVTDAKLAKILSHVNNAPLQISTGPEARPIKFALVRVWGLLPEAMLPSPPLNAQPVPVHENEQTHFVTSTVVSWLAIADTRQGSRLSSWPVDVIFSHDRDGQRKRPDLCGARGGYLGLRPRVSLWRGSLRDIADLRRPLIPL